MSRRKKHPTIVTTAGGAFLYAVGYGALLGVVGALLLCVPILIAVPVEFGSVAIFAIPLGGLFGSIVGIVTGLVFAALVVIGDRRQCQPRVADAMPFVAIVLADAATAVAFVSWTSGQFVIVAELVSSALACFGGLRIARAYLRSEDPRMRQLIH